MSPGNPGGPVAIRDTATIPVRHLQEIGERSMPGKAPVKIFDMRLTRVGDSAWPGAYPVNPHQVVVLP